MKIASLILALIAASGAVAIGQQPARPTVHRTEVEIVDEATGNRRSDVRVTIRVWLPQRARSVDMQPVNGRPGFFETTAIPRATRAVLIEVYLPEYGRVRIPDAPARSQPYSPTMRVTVRHGAFTMLVPTRFLEFVNGICGPELVEVCRCCPRAIKTLEVIDVAAADNDDRLLDQAGMSDRAGERLFWSRCPLNTVPQPEMLAARVAARTGPVVLPSVARRDEPWPIPFPSRIRVPFADEVPPPPMPIVRDDRRQ
jgi:hypothetical protein